MSAHLLTFLGIFSVRELDGSLRGFCDRGAGSLWHRLFANGGHAPVFAVSAVRFSAFPLRRQIARRCSVSHLAPEQPIAVAAPAHQLTPAPRPAPPLRACASHFPSRRRTASRASNSGVRRSKLAIDPASAWTAARPTTNAAAASIAATK